MEVISIPSPPWPFGILEFQNKQKKMVQRPAVVIDNGTG